VQQRPGPLAVADEIVVLDFGRKLAEGNCDEISRNRKVIEAYLGEEYAADCLAVNGTVLVAKGYPKTKRLVEKAGFSARELDVSEFRKGDGALTCLSILF
jgi:N-dimethylarginine dimethylaminohydrolase